MSRTRRISPDYDVVRTLRVRKRHTECACYKRQVCCNAVKFALTFFSALLLSAAFSAAKAEEAADSKQLRFHRVYAPANRMDDWPTGGGKYLPLETDEFQRLLDAVRSGGSENHGSFSSRITAAEYRAELTGEQALSGRATLEITHSGESPGMLTLEPISAAIHKTAWDLPGKEAKAEIKKPLLGLDSSGKTRVLVEQSGRLIIDWSLARERLSDEAMEYLCEFPACPVNVLRLDLPKDLTPTSDKGVISSEQSPADGRRQWRIDLGGNSRFHLRLAAAGAGNASPPPLLSESMIYDFSPRGIDLSVQWKIRAHGKPLEKIAVHLDPGLQLAAAHVGEIPATWEIEPLQGDAGSRAVLSLPEAIKDSECILRLDVLAKLNLDRPRRLPRIKPEGLFWQEGVITLIVPDPLVIQRLRPIGCSQTAVGPLPEPRTGESLEFRNFSADATVEIALARRIPHTELVTGTAVELGAGQITARVAADLRSDDAGLLTLEADAANAWTIDSVETNPSEMLADWSLENRPGGKRSLFVRLSKAPTPKQALRLAINCRRPRTFPACPWKVGDLLPLRFVNPAETRRLAAVQAGDLYELKIGNAEELTRLAPRDLSPSEQELFAPPPAGLLFEDNAGAAAMEIALSPRRPAFSGSVLVEATASKDRLKENFTLRCFPESSGIERVLVQLSQSGKVPPRWTLAGDDALLSSRQWSKDEQAGAGLATAGEIWELKLPKPRNEPFEIRGTRDAVFADPQAVCLASLPEADSQQGTLIIRSLGDKGPRIDNHRLKPIPPAPTAGDEYSGDRATFRFDPLGDAALSAQPAVTLSAEAGKTPPPVWVRKFELQSWFESQGAGRHLAAFDVHNCGGGRLRIALPPGISNKDVRGMWIDESPVDWLEGSEKNNIFASLPAAKRFCTVSIYYTTQRSGLGTLGTLAPPLPEVDVPTLAGTWTVWLPPGYETAKEDHRRLGPHRPEITFSRRLLGPLGRDPGQKVFNPFAAQDWLALAEASGQTNPAPSNAFQIDHIPAGCNAADTQGWSVQELEISAANASGIKYIRTGIWQLWAAVVFVLALGVGYWKAGKYPATFTVLTGVFGIAALILPEIYVPLASAAVLGMLACLLLMIIRSCLHTGVSSATPDQAASKRSPPSDSKKVLLAERSGAILLIAAAFFFAWDARSEEPAEKTRPPASTGYRVFVPIDEEKKPAGDKVYLPEEFFNELYRLAAAAKEEPQGWLLESARYRGSLEREAAGGLSCQSIKAQYDLRIFGRSVQVRIPLRRENARLITDSATLDGRPLEVKWEADGAALGFEAAEPGDYRLELQFRPVQREMGAWGGFEMPIPRLAQSRLELALPGEMPGIEAASALGASGVDGDPPRFWAELGPSNSLAVHWPEAAAKSGAAGGIEADQLTWLRVRPGSVAVEARFKFHLAENQVRRLQFAADPRLHLLPLEGKDPPGVHIRSDGARRQIITLQWSRPLAGGAAIDLAFLLTGASGVGNFRLPQIEPLDVQRINRCLAVSVDPILEYETHGSPEPAAATTAELQKNWDLANPAPLLAYRLENDKPDWSISTRPRQPETPAEQTLALSYDQNKVDVYFEAQTTAASGYVFQYQLSAARAMKVLNASVRKDGVAQAARWSQDADGTITIFLLAGPADGKQQLFLHGEMPMEKGKQMPLPNIRLERHRLQSTTVKVFRRPVVDLDLALPGETNSPLPTNRPCRPRLRRGARWCPSVPGEGQGEGISERGRLVKTFRLEGDNPIQGEVRLRANRPKIDAKQVTRMFFDGQKWMARADFLLDITGGLVDELWIKVPKSWKEPYTIDPPAAIKTGEILGDARQLLLQPASAVQGRYRFSISGLLETEPCQAPPAPDIILSRAEKYSRWLVLPRKLKGQAIQWETRGMRPAGLPAELAPMQDGNDNFTFEIVGEGPKAVLRTNAVASGSANVHLADVQLAWQADGACRGTAVFDLEPGGKEFCPLNLPQGCELIYAAIDGQTASPVSSGPGKWKLPLVSGRLPQHIEIVFRQKLIDPLGCGRRDLAAPSLGDVPVARTLWTIFCPPSLIFQKDKDEKALTSTDQERIRVRTAAAIIASAENLLSPDDAEETHSWYETRTRQLCSTLAAMRQEQALTADPELVHEVNEEIEAADRDQAEFAQRIGLGKVWAQAKAESHSVGETSDYCRLRPGEAAGAAHFAIDGPATSINIELKSVEHITAAGQIAASLCLAGVVGLFILGLRRGTWAGILKGRPCAVGVAAGLAWWWWLRPSILGLAIAVFMIFGRLAHRRQMPQTKSGSTGS